MGRVWREGEGEAYAMTFDEWLQKTYPTAGSRIVYFKKYATPPRYLYWLAGYIWNLEQRFDAWGKWVYEEEMARLKEVGFEGTEDFEKDLGDGRL